jgi:hypothetical protein
MNTERESPAAGGDRASSSFILTTERLENSRTAARPQESVASRFGSRRNRAIRFGGPVPTMPPTLARVLAALASLGRALA